MLDREQERGSMTVQLLTYTRRTLARQQKTRKAVSEVGEGGKGISTSSINKLKQRRNKASPP